MNGRTAGSSSPSADVWFNWNAIGVAAQQPVSAPPYSGTFFDETLRDGLQAPNIRNPSLEQKLRLVDHMVRSGVTSADLGFPGSDPAALRTCVDIAQHIVRSGHPLSQGYAGRTHPSDINAICEIAQQVGVAVDAYIFIGVSPIRQYVEDWDVQLIQRHIRESVVECRRGGAEFVLVLEDAVRCTPEVLGQVYDVAIDTGVRRVTLCDTVGAALPSGVESLIQWSHQYFQDRGHQVAFEWHGHNDRGLALANSLTALAHGCERVHGTILGIGERAGNASLDQLMVNSHLDEHGRYDLKALREYSDYAASVLGVEVPQNYPALGRDVFKTSAGVHASAILKAHEKGNLLVKDTVYSSVPASCLGREQEVLIDEASGANNVKYWLTLHGYDSANTTLIKNVLAKAKSSRGPLTDEQIRQIIANAE
ncbi:MULTISPECIES: LeuA family protein [Streptomyces]|uniref:LeuA family protein n=1 Tax=Streptomyces pratisoli TaxID=3139917 RepID=A0ACC6QPZ6_9ACTN|nr:LeuA family protein [Streptomyces sp. NBC_00259]